jgi:uncharacterized protein (DUF697 family)
VTAERVKAQQAARTRPPGTPPVGQWIRCTVASVAPLAVTLPGGAVVAAAAVQGQTYTVNAAALVFWQEPNVGPCLVLA